MGVVLAGESHYLALKPDGNVVAWGSNNYGQLGTGDTKTRVSPVLVQGLSNIVSIQSGSCHNLALRSDGAVLAWGCNGYGQMGFGNTTNVSAPERIETLNSIVSIAVGEYHSLALQADGSVWAWGHCYYKDSSTKTLPTQVEMSSNIVAIAAGGYQSFALASDGTIWSWGRNYGGQVGNGTNTKQYIPMQIATINNIISISTSIHHTMALHKDGSLYAWGDNRYGKLGNGNTSHQYSPIKVLDISNAINIECSDYHSYAQLMDGSFMIWGYQYKPYPQKIQNMNDIIDLSAYGYSSKVALTKEGKIITWNSQLPVFKEVMSDSENIIDISSDCEKTCIVLNDGHVWCWGYNNDGMGNLYSLTPLQITKLNDIKAFETNNTNDDISGINSALRNDGTVWNWGENGRGQLGNGTTEDSAIPIQVQNLDNIVSVCSKGMHSLAIKEDGSVWAWGYNYDGQLGDGTIINRYAPVHVANIDNIVDVANNYEGSMALSNDGTVWAWGGNWDGILGDGTTIERHEPVKLNSLSDVVAIRASETVKLALKSDGTVWRWGTYDYNSLLPQQIPSLENIVEIDISRKSYIARASNNDIWVWGDIWNQYTFEHYHHPILIKNIPGVSKIKAGYACFFFFMEDETVWMWGYEHYSIPSEVANIFSTIQIQKIADQTFTEDSTFTIPVSLAHTTDVPYTISVHATNPFLLHEPTVIQKQDAFDLMFTTRQNQHGQTSIVCVAEDSHGYISSSDFLLTIDPSPDLPEITNTIPQQILVSQDTPYTSPMFYITDPDTAPSNLSISISSSNQSLLSDDEITYNCTYDNCYLVIPPKTEDGSTDIEVTLSDSSGLSVVTGFSFDITRTKYQMVYLMSEDVKYDTGKAFTLPVMYDVSDKNNTLPGLGIRIHYDSTILTYLEASNNAQGLIISQEKAEEPMDSDNDPNSDRMIALAWADISEHWPNKILPYHLLDLTFQVKTEVLSNNTSINLEFASFAPGYFGKSENSTIHIDTQLPSELTFEQTELTLNHMAQTVFSVSDSDSESLTLVAFSSDPMLIPDAFINLGNSSNIKHINLSSDEPVSLSLTCYQADKNYGQAVITVEAYDESGFSASQQLSISVSPFHTLTCENCEITQTMGMVSAGGRHYLALKPDGSVVAWGKNNDGQLGTGDTKKE
ncbi:MAG: regulator of chromosome condensation RCC1 [Candidatus Magnetoglobus multicellularis str. Araruama]|uniref:Regulator of chromosome condensation RCC1 n=1 Tax=Candidatus Magnetoglobus multicellularis str. Araruama TaxID=890399 RepID=A0A1V1PAL7_9BACT|nr:MAG: regulator of chromosome condensation RCC1 [Candidatus Magnetoglobus multicellularis str. Araruama]